jgi:hypothetical protein
MKEYEQELKDLQQKAESMESASEAALVRHEILESGVTLFHIAIAVVAIAVLSRQRVFWYLSVVAGAIGLVFLVRGIWP